MPYKENKARLRLEIIEKYGGENKKELMILLKNYHSLIKREVIEAVKKSCKEI